MQIQQEFKIKEHDNHIEICACLTPDKTHIDIPDEINGKPVTVLGDDSFSGATARRYAYLDTVKTIGVLAFAQCTYLREAIIPDSVTDIGRYAYLDCKALKKVIISSAVKRLPAGMFAFCRLAAGTEIVLQEGLEEIEEYVFSGDLASSLTLRLPESVKKVAVGAFLPGMKIVTSLPHDEGWFSHWPYGESVICKDSEQVTGKVSNIKNLEGGCELHEVALASGSKKYFYPCDYADGIIEFTDKKNQAKIENSLLEMKAADEDESRRRFAYKLSDAWRKGLI